MADPTGERSTATGRSRSTAPLGDEAKVGKTKAAPKPKRAIEAPTVLDDLTGKFLRVGNKLYRSSDDKVPIVKIEPDRLKTSNIDALPDIMRIARAHGWTSIKLSGGDRFKKAAYLAAAAQGMAVENYSPPKLVQAEAERLRARIAKRDLRRGANTLANDKARGQNDDSRLKLLSERFLSQSHAQNAADPDLRRAQKLVTETIAIARAKYPNDALKAYKEVEARRQEVALHIARGDKIAVIQLRNSQVPDVRAVTQGQTFHKEGRSR